MKKILLFISSMVVGATGFAQSVPNGAFESWTGSNITAFWSSNVNVYNSLAGAASYKTTRIDSVQALPLNNQKYAVAVHAGKPGGAYGGSILPGVSVVGDSTGTGKHYPYIYFDVISPTNVVQTIYGSFTQTVMPQSLSGFARYRTTTGGANLGGIAVAIYSGGSLVGGYVNAAATSTVSGSPTNTLNANIFPIDTSSASSGLVNFNIPLTTAGTAIDSVQILLFSTLPSQASAATLSDTLWVDALRFLSCKPDTSVHLGTSNVLKPGPVTNTVTLNGNGAYTQVWTVAVPTTSTLTTQFGTFPLTTDSTIWDPIGPKSATVSTTQAALNVTALPAGSTYKPGYPSGVQYGNSIYCFTLSGTIPSSRDTTFKFMIDQTAYGVATGVPIVGTLTLPSTTPANTYHLASDSIMFVIGTGVPGTGPAGVESYSGGNQFGLSQNIPNPFNGTTTITFTTPTSGNVQFTVMNVLGIVVSSQTVNASAGVNTITFSAGSNGPGTYFYSVSDGTNSATKKLIIY